MRRSFNRWPAPLAVVAVLGATLATGVPTTAQRDDDGPADQLVQSVDEEVSVVEVAVANPAELDRLVGTGVDSTTSSPW